MSATDPGLERAKALYFDYLGSTFGMAHDGVLEEYRQYAVSAGQETQWRQELIALWVGRLSAHDTTAAIRLSILQARESLPHLLACAEAGDSYAHLIYANCLWEIAHSPGAEIDPAVSALACQTAVRIWRTLTRSPIILAEDRNLQPFNGATPQEFIWNWAQTQLTRAENTP